MKLISLIFIFFAFTSQAEDRLQFKPVDSRLFPFLYTSKHLFSETTADELFASLPQRFENDNFSEILFVDSDAKSARYTPEDAKRLVDVLKRKFNPTQNVLEYLMQKPSLENIAIPLRKPSLQPLLFPGKPIRSALSSILNKWNADDFLQDINFRELKYFLDKQHSMHSFLDLDLKDVFTAQQLLKVPTLIKPLLMSLKNLYLNTHDEKVLQSLSQVLGGYYLATLFEQDSDRIMKLDDFNSYLLAKNFKASILDKIKELRLPGKISHRFSSYFALPEFKNPFKDMIAIVPMSRWDALTKGVGPGECLRASANRYLDAFFPSAIHLSLLKNGKEIGYIGIYKVLEKKAGKKIWYIDVVQSPDLVSAAGDAAILDMILLQLQRWALRDHSLLAVAAKDWNAINFKENTNYLEQRGKLEEAEVFFESTELERDMRKFVSLPEQHQDQNIMRLSGYNKSVKSMYDSLLRNSNHVAFLSPHKDLTLEELKTMLDVLQIKTHPRVFLNSLENKSMQRFLLLSLFPQNGETQEQMYQLYNSHRVIIDNTQSLRKFFIKNFYKNILLSFKLQWQDLPTLNIPQLALQLSNEKDSATKNSLALSLLYLSPDADTVFKILNQVDMVSKQGIPILINSAIPVLERLDFKDWLQFFEFYLTKSLTDETDMSFGIAIAKKVKNLKEFFTFFEIATEQTKRARMSTPKNRAPLLTEYFIMHLKNESLEVLLPRAGEILGVVKIKQNVRIRAALLEKAKTQQDILNILNISNPPPMSVMNDYVKSVNEALSRITNKVTNSESIFSDHDFLILDQIQKKINSPTPEYMETLFSFILPKNKSRTNFAWASFFQDQLHHTYNDSLDARLFHAVSPHITQYEDVLTVLKAMYQVDGKLFVGESIRYSLALQFVASVPWQNRNSKYFETILKKPFSSAELNFLVELLSLSAIGNFHELWQKVNHLNYCKGDLEKSFVTEIFLRKIRNFLNDPSQGVQITPLLLKIKSIDWSIVFQQLSSAEIKKLNLSLEDLLDLFNQNTFSESTLQKIKMILKEQKSQVSILRDPTFLRGSLDFTLTDNKSVARRSAIERYQEIRSFTSCEVYFAM